MYEDRQSRRTSGSNIEFAAASYQQVNLKNNRILNCVPSLFTEDDWRIDTAAKSGLVDLGVTIPAQKDLREDWWTIRDQGATGACVGFSSADGVLRWHYVKSGLIHQDELTSPRFIWMANKETDAITEFPTTFVESAGTQTKSAMRIAHRYGCLLEKDLPMSGALWQDTVVSLYSRASRLRIESFFNLGNNLDDWRRWIATKGPILTRLSVDDAFMNAGSTARSRLNRYDKDNPRGGHAVALVGYTEDYFIVRNSWGTSWGHGGFAYATDEYASEAFTEGYGVVVTSHGAQPPIGPGTPSIDSTVEPLTKPRFEGLTIELAAGEGNALKRANTVARQLLGSDHGWRIEPVHPSEPLDFDLLPPLGREVETDVATAWSYCHKLKALPEVDFAEPSFVVNQDNDPNLSVPGGGEVETAGADGDLSDSELLAAGLPVVERRWRDWSPLFIRAREAWGIQPRSPIDGFRAGKRRGEGVLIGHPDSGYRSHRELWNPLLEPRMRIIKDLDRDFVDNDLEPMDEDGDHGLATASVIMSWEPGDSAPSPDNEITGVAPRADIVPLRVAKKRFLIPVPVLFRSGMIRLRRAIDYGTADADCEVFSISLGWLPNRSLHKAIKRAVHDHDAIIVAAAGNHVRIVVWPGHFKETVCVAACNHRGGKWKGSSRGRRVDVTGPGENIWKADMGDASVKKSSGTSYSAASTAGLAALWLAHWGRDFLKDKYPTVPLAEVFRYVLKRSCVRPPGWNTRKWGSGIVDAKALLEKALPETAQVRQAMRYKSAADKAIEAEQFQVLAEAFEEVPLATLKARLTRLTGQADAAALVGLEDELTFHILTTPTLRNALSSEEDDTTAVSLGNAGQTPMLNAISSELVKALKRS